MKSFVSLAVAGALAASAAAAPTAALAWGNAGHRMAGEAAARVLPKELPAFLRTPAAVRDIGELSREPDRSKGSGRIHDHDRNAAHFVDIDEEGRVLGGPPFAPLQATRNDYETALREHGLDAAKAGYLQFAIVDRYQQLVTDFAYWRVLKAAEANPAWRKNRAWFKADRLRREGLILHTLGELSHYVADGAQPLHASVHFNGWGDYPNPQGFTQARIHGPFEEDVVKAGVDPAAVAAKVAPFRSCGCAIEQRVVDYLMGSMRLTVPLYELEKAGGLKPGDPRGAALASERIAVGASELRDLVVEAWADSAKHKVGWRPVAVQDVLAGKVDPYPALYGLD